MLLIVNSLHIPITLTSVKLVLALALAALAFPATLPSNDADSHNAGGKMQQQLRDALLFVVAPLAILGGLTGWMLAAAKPACHNTVVQEVLSPDQRFKAVLFGRTCAGDPAVSSHISILVAKGVLPDSAGNLFSAAGAPQLAGFTLTWQQPAAEQLRLMVSSQAPVQVFTADTTWSVDATVSAEYQLTAAH